MRRRAALPWRCDLVSLTVLAEQINFNYKRKMLLSKLKKSVKNKKADNIGLESSIIGKVIFFNCSRSKHVIS
jgi:hypothetical protein